MMGGQSSAIELVLILSVILASIVIFLLLIPNYSYSAGSEVNMFQLNAMAQSLLQYIVTSPGNPIYWGLNASQITSFGLAEPNQPYHLDPFKVMALVYWDYVNGLVPSPVLANNSCLLSQISGVGFRKYLSQYGIGAISISNSWLFIPSTPTGWLINYDEVKELLGLGGDYDFMLVITPVLNITVTGFPPSGPGGFNLYIRVLGYGSDSPVSGASVSIQYFITDQAGNDLACQYGILTPCTPAPSTVSLPNSLTFTIIISNPLVIEGSETSMTNASGVAAFTLPMAYDGDNTYFLIITASIGGLSDYTYYQYPAQSVPLLTVGILPSGSNYNSVIFVDPHILRNCLSNIGVLQNPGSSALGLRIIAVYRSLYGYSFESLNFTLNPGGGSHSYPIPCSVLALSNANDYSTCYWNLPNTPMILIANVVRNSQGQSPGVPITQTVIIPYGSWPNYLMDNGPIVFGKSIKYAPVSTARALVYIGDSAYYITLYLYYKGDVYGPMNQQ